MNKQNKMDEFGVRIAALAEEAKLICRNRGLTTVDKVTIVVRDEDRPGMHFVVSNDPGCSFVFWYRPEDVLPDGANWVLASIRPVRYTGDVQDPDYLALAAFDGTEWRTKYGRTPAGYKVMAWCDLPIPENSHESAS